VKEADIEAILKLRKDGLAHLKIWSTASLPKEIKKLDNFNCFRKKVKSVLLSKSLYMLEEFLNTKSVQ